ncbi:uncharacterized protein [Littorina saxatilis]|uniref:uncharacterized protein n=1 Tax=Littorina saxatilis TaxID=31220 RepID=UPI0038B63624
MSVAEGSNVTCTCQNEGGRHGYPLGRVVWTNNTGSAVLALPGLQKKDSGVVHACRLLWGPHDEVFDMLNYSVTVNSLHFNQEPDSELPVAAVAGSVVSVVFIVTVVIVIAVIVKRRRPKAEDVPSREDATSTANGATDTYDGLYMPDVGQSSIYSEMGQRPVNAASDADYIDLYHGLDMSEVGQRAEYSQLGQDT